MAGQEETDEAKVHHPTLARELFIYNPYTGKFKRRRSVQGVPADKPVGHMKKGRLVVGMAGRNWPLTHIAWMIKTGDYPPAAGIQHANGDKKNFCWHNLREYNPYV